MNQDYFSRKGESSKRAATEAQSADGQSERDEAHYRPNYMTVGDGSLSESAKHLQAWLDDDSGYAGSAAGTSYAQSWARALEEDRPTPPPVDGTHVPSESERRMRASHVHQLYYNHNRTTLARAITKLLQTLQGLQETNNEWPLHYPSPRAPATQERYGVRPGLHHTQTMPAIAKGKDHTDPSKRRPNELKRAESAMPEDAHSENDGSSSKPSAEDEKANEPRLVTPQLARDFSVLKIDLQMDRLSQADIISSLKRDSKALAGLVDSQISKSKRHLLALRDRIEDTSSKVLITGDLNAGKSSFCNALLRKKVLPEDEQPCTSIFCEVLDVRKNRGIEEVHAISHGRVYDHDNESTYKTFPLSKLEDIVTDSKEYAQCKVYVKDTRNVDESLLNNGVLDIALIDAPGLNHDSLQTTAIFARQEEIDVVVFVVSAANHFTQSAREFILDAAREKDYMFMVVNGFDLIKDKQRCQERILRQVQSMTPATFKESADLVHFVSSNAIPVAPFAGTGGPSSSASASEFQSSGDPGKDDPGDEDDDGDNDGDSSGKHGESNLPSGKGKAKQRQKQQDFEHLEASLRQFVLEKRARSKLAPAKTYLIHVLDDLDSLGHINLDVAESELNRVGKELAELEPLLEQSRNARTKASDDAYQSTEDTAQDVYSYTRDTINGTISEVSNRDLGVEYPGFLGAYGYAEEITSAMIKEISEAVDICENYARHKTSDGVNAIKSIGLMHLGDAFVELNFHADKMLKRRKDALARQVDIDVDLWDFFDFASLWDRQEKITGSTMAVTVAGVVGGRLLGGAGWVDGVLGAAKVLGPANLRRMAIPGLLLTAALAVSYAIASIPQSLPKRLNAKLASQLASIDFTHTNALRISSEVRRALKIPSENLRVGLQRHVEGLQQKREDRSKIKKESEVARKYFSNLLRDTSEIVQNVRRIDLDGPPPGMAGSA